MTHPEDLLAEYVDGTLADDQRAVVDAHLVTCARCRQEIEAAGRAVSALAALPEEPVPLGVTGPVVAEAEGAGHPAPRRRPAWERFQWAGGLAAAAALLLVAVVLLPQLTGRSGDEGASGGSARAPAAEAGGEDATLGVTAPPVQMEVLDRDLDDDDLRRLAEDAADAAPAVPEREASAVLEPADPAISCLTESGMIEGGDVLVRAIRAGYLGTPAYVGVFHESPAAGEPPEKILVLVVSSSECTFLTAISQRI